MKICLISVEIFAWGKYGGFGRATRTIGRELVTRGHTVSAVVPLRRGQRPVEELDGMTVYGFPPSWPWAVTRLFKACDADVYHACSPSFTSYLAVRSMPRRAHVVTVRDPRDSEDWRTEFLYPSLHRMQVVHNYLYEHSWPVQWSVRHSDAVYAPAECFVDKIRRLYDLPQPPGFLPTPVAVPPTVRKAAQPTVCYVARLDRRKRPTLFLDLARRFPHVKFIAVGESRDRQWDAELRARYAGIPNLELTGFIDQFSSPRLNQILDESWIMVNTAAREGLPNAFLEASAHQCAILSAVDPDGFASQFGCHVTDDDFAKGLSGLLAEHRWQALGRRGQQHVLDTFSVDRAVERHLAAYDAARRRAASR
jgi:glycosyltransferase involved in cell wall biosynthesis